MLSALKTPPSLTIRRLLSSPEVQRAFRFFETQAEAITDEHIHICSIPASPFGEQARAEYLSDKFSKLGLSEVEIDEEGNCLGLIKGASLSPLIVVSAHLDTVFPEETNFSVVRRDDRLFAPGIADDGCGLAALIALAEAIQTQRILIEGSILFVGTVGEEGDRKSTRLNSSHGYISYAVFCLKKKNKDIKTQ